MGIHIGVQRRARQQKSYAEIKPLPDVKPTDISQYFFAEVV